MKTEEKYPGQLGVKIGDRKLSAEQQYQEAVNEYILANGQRAGLLAHFNTTLEQRAELVWDRLVRSRIELERAARLYANEKWPVNGQRGFDFLVASAEKKIVINGSLTGANSKDELNAVLTKWAQAKVALGE